MIEKSLEIINKKGLHARAAAKLIDLTQTFESTIFIAKGITEVNGKSILGLLMLAAHQGTVIKVRADGQDEQEAIQSISLLIESKFQENE